MDMVYEMFSLHDCRYKLVRAIKWVDQVNNESVSTETILMYMYVSTSSLPTGGGGCSLYHYSGDTGQVQL